MMASRTETKKLAHFLSPIYDPFLTSSIFVRMPPSGSHLREKLDHPHF